MQIHRLKLTTKSPITSFPSSDTLFGAICWGIRTIKGNHELTTLVDGFHQHSAKFILSSSFPLVDDGETRVFFYPKPIGKGILSSEIEEISEELLPEFGTPKKSKVEVISAYKEFKKANYVSASILKKILEGLSEAELFREYLCGKDFSQDDRGFNANLLGGRIKIFNKMMLTDDEYSLFFERYIKPQVIESTLMQKNSLDRISFSTTGEGQTFYLEQNFLGEKMHLYFLIKTNDIDYLKPALKYLEDTGIGGNRSVGQGYFRITLEENINDLPIINGNENFFITLSRYLPNKEEVYFTKSWCYYELLPYRSKVESNFEFKGTNIFKNKVIYLKEGSVLPIKEKKDYYGRLAIVKQLTNSQIYQNGLAFPVFGKVGEEDAD